MNSLKLSLKNWYLSNHRELPWRNTVDPYKIWLSEIILQQTRVEQGLPYYLKFIENFPTVHDLANAQDDYVMKCWEGLGYYSRARNLLAAARQIVNELEGVFPSSYKEIIKLKGIGPYTGAAIASFAFKEKVAVVDGNVFRVLSRLYNESSPIDSTKGKKTFQLLADEFLNQESPDIHNQAMMELGAMICYPKNPSCQNCPLNDQCLSAFTENWRKLPYKEKKVKTEKLFLSFQVYLNQNQEIKIERREAQGIWQNLYQFPVIENKNELPLPDDNYSFVSRVYKHILTHRKIQAQFFIYENSTDSNGHWIKLNRLKKYAFPKLIVNFLDDHNWFE